jgi:hypothetical protein
MWKVEYTDQFEAWWLTLSEQEQEAVTAAVEALEDRGPALGRALFRRDPSVTTRKHERAAPSTWPHPGMFAFDPRRTAILLIGGDKTGQWESRYEEMVPIADVLCDEHLRAVEKEGAKE